MTLDEARDAIGRTVTYCTSFGRQESGVITSVNNTYVFVRYNPETEHGTATYPEDLKLSTDGGV